MSQDKYDTRDQRTSKRTERAYIPDWYPGFPAQVQLLEGNSVDGNVGALRLVTVGALLRRAKAYEVDAGKRSVPIPHYIWSKFGGSDAWEKLLDTSILEDFVPHKRPWEDSRGNWHEGRCREFIVSTAWLFEYAIAGLGGLLNGQQVVNIYTGLPVAAPKTRVKDDAKNYLLRPGYLGHDVLNVFADHRLSESSVLRCPVDLPALVSLAQECMTAARTFPEDLRLRSYAIAISHLLVTLSYQDLRRDDSFVEGGHSFRPVYDVLSSGRIMQTHGGLQMTPCVIRWAALRTVPGLINVDMVGAQAAALHRLCSLINLRLGWFVHEEKMSYEQKDELKVPTEFTERWAKNSKQIRTEIAEETGLDVDVVKSLTFILVFGGGWNTAVLDALLDYFQDDEAAAKAHTLLSKNKHIKALKKVTKRLARVIDFMFERPWMWRTVGKGKMGTPAFSVIQNQHGVTVTNAVGATLSMIDGTDGTRRCRSGGERVSSRHVAAHLAQGLEQEFMMHFRMGVLTDDRAKAIDLRYCLDAFDGAVLWYDPKNACKEEALKLVIAISVDAQRCSHIANASSIVPKEIVDPEKYLKFREDLRRAVEVACPVPQTEASSMVRGVAIGESA